jgi:hypothetical protein
MQFRYALSTYIWQDHFWYERINIVDKTSPEGGAILVAKNGLPGWVTNRSY